MTPRAWPPHTPSTVTTLEPASCTSHHMALPLFYGLGSTWQLCVILLRHKCDHGTSLLNSPVVPMLSEAKPKSPRWAAGKPEGSGLPLPRLLLLLAWLSCWVLAEPNMLCLRAFALASLSRMLSPHIQSFPKSSFPRASFSHPLKNATPVTHSVFILSMAFISQASMWPILLSLVCC